MLTTCCLSRMRVYLVGVHEGEGKGRDGGGAIGLSLSALLTAA